MCVSKIRWTHTHFQSENMDIDQRLNQVADRYRAQGYKVVVRPGPGDLPDFAKKFKVEIVARSDAGSALISAKKSPSDLQSDPSVASYAEITEKQPGWRFDLVVLGSDDSAMPPRNEAKEPSEEDIHRSLADVERMLQAGFVQQALIAAWAVLETAMRRRLHAEGEDADWGTSPRTMLNELYSSGILQSSEFRDLEGLFQARSAIVHGFTSPVINKNAIQLLADTARRLLMESQPA
jgi:hypothetical protein